MRPKLIRSALCRMPRFLTASYQRWAQNSAHENILFGYDQQAIESESLGQLFADEFTVHSPRSPVRGLSPPSREPPPTTERIPPALFVELVQKARDE